MDFFLFLIRKQKETLSTKLSKAYCFAIPNTSHDQSWLLRLCPCLKQEKNKGCDKEYAPTPVTHIQLATFNNRVPWKARRSNQSILKEINPEYSLKGLMLKLKLQYFGPLIWRADSLEKNSLMKRKIEGSRKRGRQRMRWLDGITNAMAMNWTNSGRWWGAGKPGVLESMGSRRTTTTKTTAGRSGHVSPSQATGVKVSGTKRR